jgi:hypothetical protein
VFRTAKRFFVIAAVGYVVLGVFFVAHTYALGTYERLGPTIQTSPVTKVPTGSSDATVRAYYDYLQLRHLQQQTETYGINPVDMIITYGSLGAVLLITSALAFMWYAKDKRSGLYPVEVYNGYIAEGAGGLDLFTLSNYAVMLAFIVFYIWWNLTFGQWY